LSKSIVLRFFALLYQFVNASFNGSVLKKIQDFFASKLKKSSDHSFFVKFFTKAPLIKDKTKNSFICALLVRIFNFFAKIVKYFEKMIENSLIGTTVLWLYKNFFKISVRCYGIFLLSFCIVCEIVLIFKSSDILLPLIIGIFAVIMIFVNLSFASIFKNSITVKKLMTFFDIDVYDDNSTIKTDKETYLYFALVGFASGLLTAIVNPVLILAIIISLGFVASIFINYTIGAFLVPLIFPFMPTMAIVGLILLTFLSMVLKLFYDDEFKFTKTNLDIFIILFALVMLVSSVFSFARISSLKIFMVYLVFMAGYFVFTNTLTDKKKLYVFLSLSVISAFLVALYGIYQYVFGFAEGSTWIDTKMFTDIETRVVSTFENPNVLGEFLLLMIPVTAAFVWNAPRGYNRFINFIAAGALCLCMIFTYSRGNWLGLIAAIIIYISFYDRKFIWFGIILALLSPLIMPQSIINRFLSIGDTSDTSTSYRVYIWFGTIKMLKDYWLCGIGLGSDAFNMIYPRYAYASIVAPHSHNLYLQIIAENGILGIIVFLGMIVTYFKDTISAVNGRKKSILKAICVALMAGMAGYFVQGAFDNVWYNYRIVMMFFMYLALSQSAVNLLRKEEDA